MTEWAVELHGLQKVFSAKDGLGTQIAVDDMNLSIRQGEFFTLLGPSGCGKSTTLRIIAGFEDPTAGEILILGRSMRGVPPYRRPVNMVFQDYALFPHLNVAQNIGFGPRVRRVSREECQKQVEEAIELVRLQGLADRKPQQLSGGQQQRVALARALINRPALLLLDEPLGALDLKLRKAMQLELKRLQHQVGCTFIYVTHDQEEALTMSDRVAVMREGRVLQVGDPNMIYERPATRFVADFIGETNFLDGVVVAVDGGDVVVDVGGHALRARWANGKAPIGSQVSLTVRPEKISLDSARPQGNGRMRGVAQEVTYLGTDTLYRVALDANRWVNVRVQNAGGGRAPHFIQGETVEVSWDPQDALVLMD